MRNKLFRWLFLRWLVRPALYAPDPFAQWRHAIAPLGRACCEIIYCLGGDHPGGPTYFNPFQPEPLDHAAIQYFRTLEQHYLCTVPAKHPDITCALIAAGLVTCGQHTAFPTVLSNAPLQLIRLDHGAGHCNRAPFLALTQTCPLPEQFREPLIWVRGNPYLQALQEWYDEYHQALVWDELQRRYVLRSQEQHF